MPHAIVSAESARDAISFFETKFQVDGIQPTWITHDLFQRIVIDFQMPQLVFNLVEALGSGDATLSPEEIEKLVNDLKAIPYIYVRRSKSGTGLHVLVPLATPIATDKPRPYALAMVNLIAETIPGFNTKRVVDVYGGQLFLHAPNPGQNGFENLQSPTELFSGELKPAYPVLKSNFVPLEKLEPEHQDIIVWLQSNAKRQFSFAEQTYHGHTSDLQRCHQELGLKGSFQTRATGTGESNSNCWLLPISGGAFVVGRWGSKCEDGSADHNGYSSCYLNRAPNRADFMADHGLTSKFFPREFAELLASQHKVELSTWS